MIAWLKDFFFQDIWLKLLSLSLAVVTWFTVSFAIQKRVTPLPSVTLTTSQLTIHRVPVIILSSASDARTFQIIPREADVTVSGDAAILSKVQSSEIRALVDLTGIESAGELRKRIEVSTPAGVTFVRAEPADVTILFP